MIALLAILAFQCPDGSPPPCSRTATRAVAINPSSVAVLYFENHARDTSDAQLADGLTEELITRLSQVGRLEVKSRFESRRFRGTNQDPRDVGRSLHAAYLVSGTLQQAGSKIRINVALLRASTGAQVWGDIFDRTGGDMLAVQSDIAGAVASAITGRLLPAEQATLSRRPTQDPQAYDLYLRGLATMNGINETGARAAIALFDQAIARDANFPDAWAQKAWAWLWLADGYVLPRDAYARAREAANNAIRLDSSQAIAWAVLSAAAEALDLDHVATIALGERAVALNPHDADSRVGLGTVYEFDGQHERAIAETQRGFLIDTLSALSAYLYLMTLNEAGRYDSLAAALPHVRGALSPDDLRPWEGLLALRRGDADSAARLLSWRYYGGRFAGAYAAALVAAGRRDAALAVRDSALAFARTTYYNSYGLASIYAALGDGDNALASLDRALDERTVWICDVAVDPIFQFLRPDPRFAALMRRIGRS